jgi:hypothetical protein
MIRTAADSLLAYPDEVVSDLAKKIADALRDLEE